jgi:periplasmic protein TonB
MQTSGRQWALALTAAVLVHGGLAVAVLWQAPPSGAISAGTGGIEIALGPSGGAPGAPAQPVEDFAETSPVDAPETVQSEMPAQAARAVPVETIEAESEPVESAEPKPEPEPTPPEPVVAESVVAEPLEAQAPMPPASPPPPPSPPASEKTPERPAAAAVAPPPAGADGKAGSEASPAAGSADDAGGGGVPGATADYMALLQAWLEKHKQYPRAAQLRRQEGTVLLSFVMDRNGRVLEYRIERASGHALLDREVEAMIERAQPLPKIPDDLREARLELVVPVQFFLR